MIDIHTHILPFVDDGSPDFESSLTLIRESVALGVTDLFLTPHFMKSRNFLSSHAKNLTIFEELQAAVQKENLSIRLHLGNEIYYRIESLDDLRAKKVVPMGSSDMVLIEFSSSEEEEDILDAIHNIKSLGYTPIVAHVERYPYVKDFKSYEYMHRMGALIQVNAGSVVGESGSQARKLVLKLIKAGLVDFVASDLHVFRTNQMKAAYETVKKTFDEATAKRLFCNTSIL